jgi:hypothetical protein
VSKNKRSRHTLIRSTSLTQNVNLCFQSFILRHLPLQKRTRKLGFFGIPTLGQTIGRAKLVFRGPEITSFYLALFSQCTQVIIFRANPYTQFAGDLSLIKVSLVFQRAKDAETNII